MTQLTVLPLLETLREHADDPDLYDLLDLSGDAGAEREAIRLLATDDYELWLISWPPESQTDWHDHGTAAGALTVLHGTLVEDTFDGGLQLADVYPGHARAFAAGHAHNLRNASGEWALSLHAYSPRLQSRTRFRFHGDRLEVLGVERAGEGW